MLKWTPGRQGTTYETLKILQWKWCKLDMWLIRYKPYGHIPPHNDPAPKGYEHHRVNITLRGFKQGVFEVDTEDSNWKRWWRFVYFRPDLYTHSFMNEYKTRIVLSIGKLIKK